VGGNVLSGNVLGPGISAVLTTAGDLIYVNAAGEIVCLPIGAANEVLKTIGGLPDWEPDTAAILTTNGDLLYRNGAGAVTRLPIGAATEILKVVGGLPDWEAAPISAYTQGARARNSADLSIADSTYTALTYDTEDYDTDGIHSTTSNTDRLTCQTAGKYLILAGIAWEGNANGVRYHRIDIGAGTCLAETQLPVPGTNELYAQMASMGNLAVGDYVYLRVWQNSGGSLKVRARVSSSPFFAMQRIG
jgi:hypothetical protein